MITFDVEMPVHRYSLQGYSSDAGRLMLKARGRRPSVLVTEASKTFL